MELTHLFSCSSGPHGECRCSPSSGDPTGRSRLTPEVPSCRRSPSSGDPPGPGRLGPDPLFHQHRLDLLSSLRRQRDTHCMGSPIPNLTLSLPLPFVSEFGRPSFGAKRSHFFMKGGEIDVNKDTRCVLTPAATLAAIINSTG